MTKSNIASTFFILFVTCLIFSKIFTKGLYPIPGDLLVSFYFPWYSGGWEGYNPWTTHKASIGDDSLRQQIPWLKLGFDEIKKGSLPLWNPYNFSGNPHLSNIQTFIFYPLNFVFLIMPFFEAWTLLILLQFFLGMTFLYLFMRKINIGVFGALLASLSFIFSNFFLFNSQINIIGHTVIWLPLILYSFESLKEKFKIRYFVLCVFAFVAMILGGHVQTIVYSLIIAFAYFFFSAPYHSHVQKKAAIMMILGLVIAILLCSFQLFPTVELYLNSPVKAFHPQFNQFLIPFKNLITFLARDFFGNPVTNNFWSRLYGDGAPHIGVISFVFAVFSLSFLKDLRARLFAVLAIASLLFALPTPFSALIKNASIPILSGTPPTRAIFITTFSLSFLAGFGLDQFLKNKLRDIHKKIFSTVAIIAASYSVIWIYLLITIRSSGDPIYVANLKVSFKNLIIPSLEFFAFLLAFFLKLKFELTKIFLIIIFASTLLSFLYTTNKLLPFAPKVFLFPNHPVINFVKNDQNLSRFYGIDTARFDTNFATYYRAFSPEGYGILRVKRYAELVAASTTGKIPDSYERADAIFPQTENDYRKRIFDLLGVKYLLDKNDNETKEWNPEPGHFPGDNVELVWQQGKFKIYQRKDSLPRYFQTTNYSVLKDNEIIQKIYDKNFDLKNLLLEKDPGIPKDASKFTVPDLESYSPNIVKFKTDFPDPTLLFISDVYFNGWRSYIDGIETPILRADYAFRSVVVPEGSHEVIFKYSPRSFTYGLEISAVTLIFAIFFVKVRYSKKQF